MSVDIRALVQRLDGEAKLMLERAAQRAKSRGHVSVEPEHLLAELLDDEQSDIGKLLRSSAIDQSEARADVLRAIDGFDTGTVRVPAFSKHLLDVLNSAWSIASLDHGLDRVRPLLLLRAMLRDQSARRLVVESCPLLLRLPAEDPDLPAPEATGGGSRVDADGEDGPLETYTIDLTAQAREGSLDPILGRDQEIRQLIDILLRRRQNNPILTGDAGVGKTAVVEGLAQRIVDGQVPTALRKVRVLSLDMSALQAGASMRGEFEHRLRGVIDAVAASVDPVVLFIDEAHTLIGAGAQAGQSDAANILKPALARGSLRTIAATTWGEYKRYFEKDPALTRRFQVVKVAEPDTETAITMLRGIAARLEAHHGVKVLEDGLRQAVFLSDRYIGGRQLPDKAVSVLDTACARVAIAQSEEPQVLFTVRARLAAVEAELERLREEVGRGDAVSPEHIETLEGDRDKLALDVEQNDSRWRAERELVQSILDIQSNAPLSEKDASELEYLRLKLDTLIADQSPMVFPAVDAKAVGAVVSSWTGIPSSEMLRQGSQTARDLRGQLSARVVHQDAALDTICRRIQTYFAKIGEPGKPTGVFLLTGPSGVGKTETAHALADSLFGGPEALVTINMSEYQEAHTISGLKGAPPGYVGYGKGGILTEAVRRRPYSVVLLDEIEKAHRDVIELFYQVFDKGMLEDSDGQIVDFRNTVILLTSNVGADELSRTGSSGAAGNDDLVQQIRPFLRQTFPAAFLGRLTVVPYLPLATDALQEIARKKLDDLRDRLALMQDCTFSYDREIVDWIVERARETESGARNIDSIVSDTLSPQVALVLLDCVSKGAPVARLHAGLSPSGGFDLIAD
ncbi:MAG: type VI secretion system ATPase TssH [Pseudomonadota bacterium]